MITATTNRPAASPAKSGPLAGAIVNLPLADIAPHPGNPRRDWARENLEELARSLQEHELLQPIVVRRAEPGAERPYQLIVGERRFRAARLAGWSTIPARVVSASDNEALTLLGVENLQRRAWGPLELAEYLAMLARPVDAGGAGMTHAKIAESFGRSEAWATNLMRLLDLPADLQAAVASGAMQQTAARALLKYRDQPEVMSAIRADLAANPDDWIRRADAERNAAFLAEQVSQADPPAIAAEAPSRPAAPPRAKKPSPPAETARRTPEPPAEAAPTLRQRDAHALLEPYAASAADLKLIRAVAQDLLTVLRRGGANGLPENAS